MKLQFKNGKFVILQVSDAQDLQIVRRAMLHMLNRAYDLTSPDLVVLTGDNILGNHLRDCLPIHTLTVTSAQKEYAQMKTAIGKLIQPIEKRGIPFAMIYGNHDDMNEITKDEQAELYRAYSQCIGLDKGDGRPDCATYNIPIYSGDGQSVRFNLWMLDSCEYDKVSRKSHPYVKEETVEWYKRKSAELRQENGGKPVPSILFQHIPMRETLSLIEETDSRTGVLHNGKRYALRADCRGILGEYPGVCEKSTGQLEAMKSCGDILAAVFGHDHLNCFEGTVDGIDFVQTPAASMRCYGGRMRGVRLFVLHEDGRYETKPLSYFELCGKGLISQARYLRDADDLAKVRAGIAASAAVSAALTVGAALIKRNRGSRI